MRAATQELKDQLSLDSEKDNPGPFSRHDIAEEVRRRPLPPLVLLPSSIRPLQICREKVRRSDHYYVNDHLGELKH